MRHAVPEPKIVGYLLTNPKKSGFFLPLGYTVQNWTQLHDDLLRIATTNPSTLRRTTPHGGEYEIIGEIQAPNGRLINLRTAWIIRQNDPNTMVFVTAYPA